MIRQIAKKQLIKPRRAARNPLYSGIKSKDLGFFERILGSKAVVTDDETLEIHNTDWTKKYQGTS